MSFRRTASSPNRHESAAVWRDWDGELVLGLDDLVAAATRVLALPDTGDQYPLVESPWGLAAVRMGSPARRRATFFAPVAADVSGTLVRYLTGDRPPAAALGSASLSGRYAVTHEAVIIDYAQVQPAPEQRALLLEAEPQRAYGAHVDEILALLIDRAQAPVAPSMPTTLERTVDDPQLALAASNALDRWQLDHLEPGTALAELAGQLSWEFESLALSNSAYEGAGEG